MDMLVYTCVQIVLLVIIAQQTCLCDNDIELRQFGGNPCSGACGANAQCRASNGIPYCYCNPGYDFEDQRCKPFNKYPPPPPIPRPDSCESDNSCPEDRKCQNRLCINPCENYNCGEGTLCSVRRHKPRCLVIHGHGGDEYGRYLKKKFEFSDVALPWLQALNYCWKKNMNLATINDREENWQLQRVLQYKGYPDSVWIGGRDYSNKKEFLWSETGARLAYTDWWSEVGSDSVLRLCPNIDKGQCLTTKMKYDKDGGNSTYKWCNLDCHKDLKFVCQYYEIH